LNNLISFENAVRRDSLNRWLIDCKRRMRLRFPKIEFDANDWPVKTLYQTEQANWCFTAALNDFAGKDQSFTETLRCLVAEMILRGKPKTIDMNVKAYRQVTATQAKTVFELSAKDFRKIETKGLMYCRAHPRASQRILCNLQKLVVQINILAEKGVLPRLGCYLREDVRAELRNLHKSRNAIGPTKDDTLLDHKIEAFNEALNALIDNNPLLNPVDRVAICVLTRKLCAPSRINEVLCSSIDDQVTVEDYVQPSPVPNVNAHRAHQMLVVTMKGSKGAQWSAKPVLTFMIDAFNYTKKIILDHGKHSRMLVEWYEKHPNTLYLPLDLETLRGNALNIYDLGRIMYLTQTPRCRGQTPPVQDVFKALKKNAFTATNPYTHTSAGKINARRFINFLPWSEVEIYLLKKIHSAMEDCRRVTRLNHYEGDLSKMLFLFDGIELPYLPYALNDMTIRRRLKCSPGRKKEKPPPTLFEKLRITMPVNGRIQTAEIDTHDPRRWLTTTALRVGEKLSDVLINKWANRSSLSQLKAYDFRTEAELATFSRMPNIPELADLSEGLEQARKLEDTYGLKTDIVVVHDAGISVTSLDRVLGSVEDRPIAKTSEQIIIVYPSRYGACLHQHHETPCRRYDPCSTCDKNYCVKGHPSTNEAIRKDAALVTTSIVRQLQTLVPALNRGVADYNDRFAEHLVMLVSRGLCPSQMVDHLLVEFHDIKDQIKDKLLRKRLEEAFVTRGYVRLLDDDNVPNGALMKYHNPRQHAAPGFEMALDTYGGREKVASDEDALIAKFPVFAPIAFGLQDERHRVEAEDDEKGD
jgi:hypothetical protein